MDSVAAGPFPSSCSLRKPERTHAHIHTHTHTHKADAMGNTNSSADRSNADDRGVHSEFMYRYETTKKLKLSYMMLKKNVATAVMTMEVTPQHLRDVGTGYSNVCACLKHGGSGGTNSCIQGQAAGREQASISRSRIDREFADESYKGFQTFCEAMDDIKAGVCVTSRTAIHERITVELDRMVLTAERVLKQGRKTMRSMAHFTKVARQVSRRERAAVDQGKDLSSSKRYAKAVKERNEKESLYKTELEAFDQLYEHVMVVSQEFCSSTTDIFLDCIVGYYREIVATIDVSDTPQCSRLQSRFRSREREVVLHQASDAGFCAMPAGHMDGSKSLSSTVPLKWD
ncbi:hypothetical protein LMJF_23_0980 [Leishmania major strain Friedlin]|uniref:BAR domain-containing protein n=1 Tax=Leishmania major TaxID=5664 RepID=Q4QB65_LEIMA|nr:hypothetical protein LMJF_23_0980 [Leishmania major strain Friedlin]CAG9574294.1 hypothetical_protein_-_conserved [Leishmania major strain Friedlin]CAJ04569.1 hypothetical protein LMJF_23_0980 [Leishmania major strain Friedlin]|eukprot:XP_001683433.1 hypothetical protein LMJF_23_0980 [Leishmania major strain Friedlin]